MVTIERNGVDPDLTAPWLGRWECTRCGRIVRLESGDRLTQIGNPVYDGTDVFWPEYREALDGSTPLGYFAWMAHPERVIKVACAGCNWIVTYARPQEGD